MTDADIFKILFGINGKEFRLYINNYTPELFANQWRNNFFNKYSDECYIHVNADEYETRIEKKLKYYSGYFFQDAIEIYRDSEIETFIDHSYLIKLKIYFKNNDDKLLFELKYL